LLFSMTGFGEAKTYRNGRTVLSEVKTVNNRYLKTSLHITEGFSALEPQIEALLRKYVRRGTVNLSLVIKEESTGNDYGLNLPVLSKYIEDAVSCRSALSQKGIDLPIGTLGHFLKLPGVVQCNDHILENERIEQVWEDVSRNLEEVFTQLQAMRAREGASMETELRSNLDELRVLIQKVEALVPQTVENYRVRLTEKVGKIMTDENLAFSPVDLVREVAVFTDRIDTSEEIVRFYSHLKQFDQVMTDDPCCGKKLDFLTQEMFREVNTIGSKANSSEVIRQVVELKNVIERIREMVQNVE